VTCFDFSVLSNNSIDVSKYTDRQKIEVIEWLMINTLDNIASELPIKHFIHGGIYAREMEIPEGTVLTGKIHLVDHIFTLSKGELSVMTDDGIKRIEAPFTFNVRAGIKKIGYAHTDVVCTTYHATTETDIDKIESSLFSDGNITWVDDIMKNNKTIGVAQ